MDDWISNLFIKRVHKTDKNPQTYNNFLPVMKCKHVSTFTQVLLMYNFEVPEYFNFLVRSYLMNLVMSYFADYMQHQRQRNAFLNEWILLTMGCKYFLHYI